MIECSMPPQPSPEPSGPQWGYSVAAFLVGIVGLVAFAIAADAVVTHEPFPLLEGYTAETFRERR